MKIFIYLCLAAVMQFLAVYFSFINRGGFAIGGEWLILPAIGLYFLYNEIEKG